MTAPAGPAGARPAQRRRPGEFGAGRKFTPRRKVCQFCVDKIKVVDYKDLGRLRRFLSERGKIEPRRKTGTCAAHQRSLNVALKRARQLALLPFTAEHIRVTGVLVREPGAPPFRGGRGPRPEVESAEAAVAEPTPEAAATPAVTTDGQAPAPSTDSPETVASLPSVEGVRETPATGPTAQEA
ncbi:MAG TPA: 30S ribosomal protein S18 [Chloroflexota bacterium]|nr:30S ribosomal protein S18 [Chloroflexota bacterium]